MSIPHYVPLLLAFLIYYQIISVFIIDITFFL